MSILYDVVTAASRLSISPWTIRKYLRSGKITPVRLGRRVLIEGSELERLVSESRGQSRPPQNLTTTNTIGELVASEANSGESE